MGNVARRAGGTSQDSVGDDDLPLTGPDGTVIVRTAWILVHIFNGNPTAYEVEFADAEGRTIAMVTLRADQVVHPDR